MQYVFGYAPVLLSDVAIYSHKRISFDNINKNSFVGVDNLLPNKGGKEISSYVPKSGTVIEFEPGDILIGNIRPYLKKIWFADIRGGTNGDVLTVRSLSYDVAYPRYLFYILSSDSFFEYDRHKSKGSKMPRGDKKAIRKYAFELPTIQKQKQIVALLDKFDSYCNDLSQGLPAEIAARNKQYEYYRDQLLNRKRLEE